MEEHTVGQDHLTSKSKANGCHPSGLPEGSGIKLPLQTEEERSLRLKTTPPLCLKPKARNLLT